MVHSVDFHAALGPGGGAAFSQAIPGQSKTFTFQATTPGLFVYHCGTPMIAEHIANGMYGLILVEPSSGLLHVDHEYYVMQGEIYTTAPKGKPGLQQFSDAKLMEENPEYFVFNGAVDALTRRYPMRAAVGETVRDVLRRCRPQRDVISTRGWRNLHSRLCAGFTDFASADRHSDACCSTGRVRPSWNSRLTCPASSASWIMPWHEWRRAWLQRSMSAGPQNAALMHAGPASPEAGSQTIFGLGERDEPGRCRRRHG